MGPAGVDFVYKKELKAIKAAAKMMLADELRLFSLLALMQRPVKIRRSRLLIHGLRLNRLNWHFVTRMS